MFDFDKAEKEAASEVKVANLAAIVLGQSSAGKSYLAGTLPGKTLFLYTQGEEHGRDSAKLASARVKGANVVAIPLDLVEGKPVAADVAYKRLLSILDVASVEKASFDTIVLDGLTEIEQLIRATSQWAFDCTVPKTGDHDGWAESKVTLKMMRPILEALRRLQRELGINYYVTCLLMVRKADEDGEILASEPKLTGYEIAAQIIPQFPDQIMIGRMVNAEGKEAPRLQFQAKASKVVKEKNGEVKKLIGFTPRLRGVPSDKLPATMAADLSAVMKLKEGK